VFGGIGVAGSLARLPAQQLLIASIGTELEEIVSFTVPANVRSTRVMERLGLTHNHGQVT